MAERQPYPGSHEPRSRQDDDVPEVFQGDIAPNVKIVDLNDDFRVEEVGRTGPPSPQEIDANEQKRGVRNMTSELPILTLSDSAAQMIRRYQGDREGPEDALRVTVCEDGLAAFDYQIQLVADESALPTDTRFENKGIIVLVDEDSIPNLRGATLDYVDSLDGGGFAFENPNVPPLLHDPVAQRVSQLLREQINPGLAAHGGRVKLLDVRDGRVYIAFGGGCQGCGMVDMTLKGGVEATLMAEIPEIKEVLDTTDHAAGTNPYQRAPGR